MSDDALAAWGRRFTMAPVEPVASLARGSRPEFRTVAVEHDLQTR